MQRTYSDKYLPGKSDYDLLKNKNADWVAGPFTKVAYVLVVLGVWALFHISECFTPEDCWTIINVLHGVVSSA